MGGKVSSRDQFGPFRQRRRSLGKPYAPKEKDTRRPTVETRSKVKRQVPSPDPEEEDTEDDEPATSRTLGSSSQDSLVPRKKKKASPAQNNGRGVTVAQNRSSASVQPRVRTQQPVRTEQTAQAQSSAPVQPSTSTGRTTYQVIPVGTSAGRTAFQMVSTGPRRIIPRPVGPADDDQIRKIQQEEEVPSRKATGFRRYRFQSEER